MKAKIKAGAFEVEIDGTPSEIATVLTALQTAPQEPPVFLPQFSLIDPCPAGGQHEYPTAWWSVSPPPCTKCGLAAWPLDSYTIGYGQTNPMPPCRTEIVKYTGHSLSKEVVGPLEGLPGHFGCTD
jgi:hypothetical protein